MKRLIGTIALCVFATLPLTAAHALDKNRPLRVVTAFAAGGVTDIAARIIADAMSKDLGMTVVVDNKPGGDGMIGLMEVVQAEPDGNTLLIGGFGGQLIPPLIKKDFPIDIEKDLTLIARPTGFSNVLVVSEDLDVHSVEELVTYAKENPGVLNFGSAGSSSSDRLTTEMFMQVTGAEMTFVPYVGGAAALNDLSAGVIQVMFANVPAAMGLIDGELIRPLAVTAPTRQPQMPDIPTMQEAGIDDFAVTSWNSFFGPDGMSEEDVATLSESIVRVSQQTDVQEALAKVGFIVIGEGAAEFRVSFAQEKERWKAVIDAAGLAN